MGQRKNNVSRCSLRRDFAAKKRNAMNHSKITAARISQTSDKKSICDRTDTIHKKANSFFGVRFLKNSAIRGNRLVTPFTAGASLVCRKAANTSNKDMMLSAHECINRLYVVAYLVFNRILLYNRKAFFSKAISCVV